MLGVQDHILVVGELVGRGNLAAGKRALLGRAHHESTRRLHTGAAHKVVINVSVQLNVLHQMTIGVGGHLATMLWVAQRWALRTV